jgi:hypothetical protein
MVHPHLPHWFSQAFDDVEHQGELQTIGFVLVVTILLGTLIFGISTDIAELVKSLH